jgi:hypothetical protein
VLVVGGYKLSREGTDHRYLLRGDVCVLMYSRGVCSSFLCSFFVLVFLRCGPCLPFYSSQGEGSGYMCGKKVKWEKAKEKNKKGGLRCGRLPPYPVGAVPLQRRDATGIDLLASPSASVTFCGHDSSYVRLCRRGWAVRAPGFA